MPTILRIDASARHAGSHSRRLGDAVIARLQASHPGHQIVQRDLAREAIPQISDQTIAGFYTPPAAMTPELTAATALSDRLIAELIAADILVISTPMYNFGAPAALKAWIDQIVRINHTFSYDGTSFGGLVPVRRAVLALSYGASGWAPGGAMAGMNFLEPYLTGLLGFLGVADVQVVRVEGTSGDPAPVEAQHAAALASLAA